MPSFDSGITVEFIINHMNVKNDTSQYCMYVVCDITYNIVYRLIQLHIITCTHSHFILIMALCRTFIAVGSATCVGARFTQFRFPKAVFFAV